MKELLKTKWALLMLPLSLMYYSCNMEESDLNNSVEAIQLTSAINCDVLIDFNGLERGLIVESLSSGNGITGMNIAGSVSVYGENLALTAPDVNHAMIFDTDNPSGNDDDLVVPGEDHQEVLIISEDLDSNDPDDNARRGGIVSLDFSNFGPGSVDVNNFVTIDNEEAGSWIAYNAASEVIAQGDISSIADATQQVVQVNATGVALLEVTFNGSGALDEFCLTVEEEEEESGCTYTQGFWKNPKKGDFPEPYSRSDIFYLSDLTWQEILKSPVKKNAYFQAAHQFIAASLNVANGASSPEEVDDALAEAQTLFSMYTPAQIGVLSGDDELRKRFIAINDLLDMYNNGEIGPGHCDD